MSSGNSGVGPPPLGSKEAFDSAKAKFSTDWPEGDLNKIKEENALLTACDMYKDAFLASITIDKNGKPFFEKLIGKLFQGQKPSGWTRQLARIEEDRMNHPDIQATRICWLQHRGQKDNGLPEGWSLAMIPETITHGVHDSGYSPTDLLPNIHQILTGGSFFDEGPRTKVISPQVSYYPGYTIPKNIFEKKGITIVENITFTQDSSTKNMTMTLVLNLDDGQLTFITTRDPTFNFVGKNTINHSKRGDLSNYDIPYLTKEFGEFDFFAGNPPKNAWFNSVTPELYEDKNVQLTGILFLLCKELGDFLQALMLRFYAGGEYRKDVACFSADKVFAVRGLEDKLDQVVQQAYTPDMKNYKNLGRCMYYTYNKDPGAKLKAQQDALVNKVKESNQIIKNEINKVIQSGNIILGGEITFAKDSPIDIFLKYCIQYIENRESFLDTLFKENKVTDYETSHKYAAACMAFRIIEKGRVRFSYTTLFPKLTKDKTDIFSTTDGVKDPILESGSKTLGDLLQKKKSIRGGANKRKTRKTRKQKKLKPYKQKGGDINWNTASNEVFIALGSNEEIYDFLLPFFFYMGIQPIFPEFYDTIIKNQNIAYTLPIDEIKLYFERKEYFLNKDKQINIGTHSHFSLQQGKTPEIHIPGDKWENIEENTHVNITAMNTSTRFVPVTPPHKSYPAKKTTILTRRRGSNISKKLLQTVKGTRRNTHFNTSSKYKHPASQYPLFTKPLF